MGADKEIEKDFYNYLKNFADSNGINVTKVIKMPNLVDDLRNLYLSKKNKTDSSNNKEDK
jgi:hypothetical protein